MSPHKIVTSGHYLCSVVNDIVYCCGGITGGWVGNYPEPFPGGRVKDYAGSNRGYLFVLGHDNRVWVTGLPGGFRTIQSPPFNASKLLGAYDDYLIAQDDSGSTWVIGDYLGGGGWERHNNLNPPFSMDSHWACKSIQEIKERLRQIEARLGLVSSSVLGPCDGPIGLLGARTKLVIANRTFRDVHVQLTKNVHTGNWGPFQINHNSERDAESKKIDFGNKATFHVMVYRNNNGQAGDLIGEFDHGVRYNAAGNDDRLEFAIVDIDGQTYLEAISLREVGRVALMLWLNS